MPAPLRHVLCALALAVSLLALPSTAAKQRKGKKAAKGKKARKANAQDFMNERTKCQLCAVLVIEIHLANQRQLPGKHYSPEEAREAMKSDVRGWKILEQAYDRTTLDYMHIILPWDGERPEGMYMTKENALAAVRNNPAWVAQVKEQIGEEGQRYAESETLAGDIYDTYESQLLGLVARNASRDDLMNVCRDFCPEDTRVAIEGPHRPRREGRLLKDGTFVPAAPPAAAAEAGGGGGGGGNQPPPEVDGENDL